MSASLEASLKLDIAQYQAQLAKARGEAKKFRDQLQSGGGFGKAFAGSGSMIAGLAGTAGLGLLVRRGMEFNQTIGDSETAIAQVLRQFKGLSTEAAKQEAAKAMKAMVDLEPLTAASLTGLVDGFLATLGASQSVGIDVGQNVELVGKFANALANAKIPAEQLAQEMRSIMTGNIGADSTLAKVLSISNDDVKKAREAGQLYEFLTTKIGVLGEAGDTAGVAFSSLSSAMDKAAGLLTEGLFSEGVQGAKDMATFLEQNADLFRDMGSGIAYATRESIKLLAELNKIRSSLTEGVGEGIGKLLGFGGVASTSIASTNRQAQDEAAAADAAAKFGPAKQFDAQGKVITPKAAAKPEAPGSYNPDSATDPKAQAAAQREINQLLAAEAALAEKRMADYLSILPPNIKLIELKREIMRLEEEMNTVAASSFGEGKIRIETEILDLKKQQRAAEADIADEKERAAEKQKEDDAKAGEQAYALELFEQEMDIINAKIAGNKELTAELERHAAIQALMNRLLDDTNLSEQEALQKATQMVDAKKDLEDKGKGTEKESKIKGYSRERQGDADDARQRAEDRVNQSRGKRDQAVKDSFGSFKGEDQRQKERFSKEFGEVGGVPQDPAKNPLGPQAQKNAQKEQPQIASDPSSQLGQQILQIMQQMLPAMQ